MNTFKCLLKKEICGNNGWNNKCCFYPSCVGNTGNTLAHSGIVKLTVTNLLLKYAYKIWVPELTVVFIPVCNTYH